MRTLFQLAIACAVLVLCQFPAFAQSRPNNATPELNQDRDDNIPDIIQYIVQQRQQWDFQYGSPEARAFTQLLNLTKKPCQVTGGHITPSLIGDGFEAECACLDGSVRMLDYDDRREYTERIYVDYIPYELPEIYVKKPDDDVVSVLRPTQ